MTTLTATELIAWLQSNWGWAAGLAASMMGLTALAGLLNRQRKDEVALWLMGAHSEAGWAHSFTTLFDAVFGRRHLSLRCFFRSALASLVAVVVIWLLMGSAETIGLRLQSELSLGSVLILGLAINVVADYVSLLETRLLLARMPRHWLAQAVVLLLDLLLSAAIIWLAIFAYVRSPLHHGEIESFAEILGVFSIFSVFFYSTFLTSVWTWAYIASTWAMRLSKRLHLADWLDVEERPILILSNVIGLVTFLGALAISDPLKRDIQGLTSVDRTLCSVFRGRVCLDVAELTPVEQAQLEFIALACEGGVTEECMLRGAEANGIDPAAAARMWDAACSGGQSVACASLGYLYRHGIGMERNATEAARLYQKACAGGEAGGCVNLGAMVQDSDPSTAARHYKVGCDLGNALGCSNLGYLYQHGLGVAADFETAVSLYLSSCSDGEAVGCVNLGYLYEHGIGVAQDTIEAANFYRLSCEAGLAVGCWNLGVFYLNGIGVEVNAAGAMRLYRRACELGHGLACSRAEQLAPE